MIVCVSISEEAMVIVEGSLEAILGDQVVTLGEGLREADVFHGHRGGQSGSNSG